MATLSGVFNIVTGALQADQAAINVTANNTANANTPGYAREVPTWEETDPVNINGKIYGTGAEVTGAASQRDRVLEARIQSQTQQQQATSAHETALTQVEDIFNKTTTANSSGTGSGLGDQVTSFFNSLNQLESSPADNSVRQNVLTAANNLAGTFNSVASQLQQQTTGLNEQISAVVAEINPLLTDIASLNQQIESNSPKADAGTLEDQRQADLTQLAQYIGTSPILTENNGLTLTTSSGAVLVAQTQAFQLTTSNIGGVLHILTTGPGPASDITSSLAGGGGQVGGLLTTRDVDIPALTNQVDSLAYDIGTQINTVLAGGVDSAGAAGTALFNLPGTSTGAAAAISVAITSPAQIAAAGTGEGPGGNTNATALANLASATIVAGQTPSDFYASLIDSLGSEVSAATTLSSAQQSSLTQLQSQRNSLSSVSLDEEASNLETYERAYQAASQFFNIIDTLIASALNLGVQSAVQ